MAQDQNSPSIKSVESGWSLLGHYYVQLHTGANDKTFGSYIVCTCKEQASAIEEALKPLVR